MGGGRVVAERDTEARDAGASKQLVDERNGMGERAHCLVNKIRDLNVRAAHRCFVLAAKMTCVQL
jgi:hypothetical protein